MSAADQATSPGAQYPADDAIVIKRTRAWLDLAVIGLNLCPFAKAPRPRARCAMW